MITLKEVLKGANPSPLSTEIHANLAKLVSSINNIASLYAKPMVVTSGLRTMEDHLRIYHEKAAREGKPFDPKKVPMKSMHLTGGAVDIADPKKVLQAWCLANEDKLKAAGLYCEAFSYTPTWVHFQILAPKSGKRFFIP